MILTGYIGLAIAFIIISSVLLFLLIRSKTHVIVKICIIPIVIWYGMALFYIPDNLRGWPTDQQISNDSRVISILINEPSTNSNGGIYLWLIDKEFKKVILDPRNVFCYNEKNTPRVYKLQYTKELHKKLTIALKKAKETGGFITVKSLFGKGKRGKKGKKGKKGFDSGNLEFDVVNPRLILKKGNK